MAMNRLHPFTFFLFMLFVFTLGGPWAGEPQLGLAAPSFPDHALRLTGSGLPARAMSGPAAPIPPFSWDQTLVVREGAGGGYVIQAFDPGGNPWEVVRAVTPAIEPFTLDPYNFTFDSVRVLAWSPRLARLDFTLPVQGAFSDTLFFQVHVGGLSDGQRYPLTMDVKPFSSRAVIRTRPLVQRSPGMAIVPGHLVYCRWQKGRIEEKRAGKKVLPEWRVQLAGKTGAALGRVEETVTGLQAIKVRPLLYGYHVVVVDPWDTSLAPENARRGSTSNGSVFLSAFGSDNLPPVTDGWTATNFFPAAGERVEGLGPRASDPETGWNEAAGFSSVSMDFGDGTKAGPLDGPTAHAFAEPGIYQAVCQVPDRPVDLEGGGRLGPGPDGLARDIFVVGGQAIPAAGPGTAAPFLSAKLRKEIVPEEGGEGEAGRDAFTAFWAGVPAGPGDRIVFCVNRNRFGRMPGDGDPPEGKPDDRIVLDAQGRWAGYTGQAKAVFVAGGARGVALKVSGATLDRTGDPRLGGAQRAGFFSSHTIALCVIPAAYPSAAIRVYYLDRSHGWRLRLNGGSFRGNEYDPEIAVSAAVAKGP
jgi:hypothetical protein